MAARGSCWKWLSRSGSTDRAYYLRVKKPGGASPAGLTPVYVGGATLWALATLALIFYLLVYVSHTANLTAYPYDLDQGEAYDVNSGWLLAQGRPIYTDNQQYPYYSSNYPPIYS